MKGINMIASDKVRVRIRLIFGIITSVVLVFMGAAFIFSCYSIYEMGGSPFTRDSVGKALSSLLVPIVISVLLVIAGFVLSLVLPVEQSPLKARPAPETVLKALSAKRDITVLDETSRRALERTRVTKKALWVTSIVVTAISFVLALVYALNLNNYSDELNDSVIRCTIAVIVALSPAIAVCAVRLIADPILIKKEISILTSAPRRTGNTEDECSSCGIKTFISKNEKELILGARIAIVALALVYIVLGVQNGGMSDVLQKAIKICTECIGLG